MTLNVQNAVSFLKLNLIKCIFILMFFYRNFDFISFALPWYALLPFAILSSVFIFILLSAFKMEPRWLKFSTLSKTKSSIFWCFISFIPILFICTYLVFSSTILKPTKVASFCNCPLINEVYIHVHSRMYILVTKKLSLFF